MSEVRRVVRDGLWDNNVVFAQMLGMCPTLATTGSANSAAVSSMAATICR